MSQCHARLGVDPRQRCSLEGGHQGDHEVSTTWTEDQCFDPAVFEVVRSSLEAEAARVSAPPPPLSIGLLSPLEPYDDENEPMGDGKCFSCGCPEQAHAGSGCGPHSCRSFVL